MVKKSAGLVIYRHKAGLLEIFLVHPGGPFWSKKDAGVWSIPKGEFEEEEYPIEAALREFKEETGMKITGDLFALDPLRQPGGKMVYAWAIAGDFDPAEIKSNTFSIEWPPKSGMVKEFPEVDRAGWFLIEEAMIKILKGQQRFITQLEEKLR